MLQVLGLSLAAPLVAARRWWRSALHYHRAGRQAELHPATLLVAILWHLSGLAERLLEQSRASAVLFRSSLSAN